MESFMETTSWQTPLFAEYYNSVSPISPGSPVASPSSPTLYQNSVSLKDEGTFGIGSETDLGLLKDLAAAPSRSQHATSLLAEIEGSQFGAAETYWNWNNELNLELFEEVAPLDFESPPSPTSQEFKNQDQLAEIDEDEADILIEDEDQFSAAYQDILESLSASARANIDGTLTGEQLISSVFSNVFDLESLPGFTNIAMSEGTDDQNESDNGQGSLQKTGTDEIIGGDKNIFTEADVRNASSELGTTYQYLTVDELSSSMTSCSSVSISDDESVTEKMLDALLDGNLTEASRFLPSNAYAESVGVGFEDTKPEPKTKRLASSSLSKTTKRPTKQRAKKATNKIEKVMRKKQQNKEAALKYRLKMKDVMSETLREEQSLQGEHDELQKQKEELSKQVIMIKQLLRDVFSARKSRQLKF